MRMGFLFLDMQKILLTGANGFVGAYLVKQLAHNNAIVATGKGECRLPSSGFVYETLDFTDEEAVGICMRRHQPEVVVHCGALSKPDECETNREGAFRVNVTGTINMLKNAIPYRSHFVFLSTDFVFDGEKGMYSEEDERSPVNYYGETKVMAEDEVMKYPYDWSIVRTVLVYGKPFFSRQNILTSTATALRNGNPLKIFNDQVRTPTYVEDLVSGLQAIIEKKAAGIFHISGADVRTPYEMAVAVARHLNLNEHLIEKVTEGEFSQPARRPLKTGFNISKAKTVLGYQPISFETGLEKTFTP